MPAAAISDGDELLIDIDIADDDDIARVSTDCTSNDAAVLADDDRDIPVRMLSVDGATDDDASLTADGTASVFVITVLVGVDADATCAGGVYIAINDSH